MKGTLKTFQQFTNKMDRYNIEELFKKSRIRNISLELTNASLAVYLTTKEGYVPCIYGATTDARIGIKFIHDVLNINVRYIIVECNTFESFYGVPVISKTELGRHQKLCMFCFSNNVDESNAVLEINPAVIIDCTQALKENIKKAFFLFFYDHSQSFSNQISIFNDNISQLTYYEYIKSFLTGDNYQGPSFEEKYKYFDVYKHYCNKAKNPCSWINLGSCFGDTIYWSLMINLRFDMIYAIESDSNNIQVLSRNIELLSPSDSKKITIINKKCGLNAEDLALDDLNLDSPVSLINMDIEGGEVDALLSAKNIIKCYKPILAICAYHKPDDLLTIPRTISKICPSYYKFILRKYSSGTGKHYNGIHRTNELVLYAVPI